MIQLVVMAFRMDLVIEASVAGIWARKQS